MANRFKNNHDAVDFTDPSALTVVPAEIQIQPEAEQTAPAPQTNDILDDIAPDVKPKGKACNVYFDGDVVKELDRLAKSKRLSRSKMVNLILRKVLLGE